MKADVKSYVAKQQKLNINCVVEEELDFGAYSAELQQIEELPVEERGVRISNFTDTCNNMCMTIDRQKDSFGILIFENWKRLYNTVKLYRCNNIYYSV